MEGRPGCGARVSGYERKRRRIKTPRGRSRVAGRAAERCLFFWFLILVLRVTDDEARLFELSVVGLWGRFLLWKRTTSWAAMLKLLGNLKSYFKYREIVTDSMVFRMHNLFTSVLLFTCSMIITANQFVGNPISCIVQGLPTHVINTYCWITSTFTMPDAFNRQVSQQFSQYLLYLLFVFNF